MADQATDQSTSIVAVMIAYLLLGGFIFVISCFFFMKILNGVYAARLLINHETTVARVIVSGVELAGRGQPSSYQFEVAGKQYNGQGGTEQKGDQIKVAYRKDQPSINRPADGLYTDILFAAGVPLALAFAFVFVCRKTMKPNDLSKSNPYETADN